MAVRRVSFRAGPRVGTRGPRARRQVRVWSRAQQAGSCFRRPRLRAVHGAADTAPGGDGASRGRGRRHGAVGGWVGWGGVRGCRCGCGVAVLAVQAVLSVRLVWADTAFQDEGTYLWAGHLEWAHVLHGVPLPPFAAYFSGAPVSTRRSARWRIAPGGWPGRGCCRWCSCWPRRCWRGM